MGVFVIRKFVGIGLKRHAQISTAVATHTSTAGCQPGTLCLFLHSILLSVYCQCIFTKNDCSLELHTHTSQRSLESPVAQTAFLLLSAPPHTLPSHSVLCKKRVIRNNYIDLGTPRNQSSMAAKHSAAQHVPDAHAHAMAATTATRGLPPSTT